MAATTATATMRLDRRYAEKCPRLHASLIVATFLGVGLTMLLGSALMALTFLSSRSGHDEAAAPQIHTENEDE